MGHLGSRHEKKIASGSLLAPEAVKHDLPTKNWRWRVPLPRVELNNRAYPPSRWPRMWPIDARAPSRHGEGEKEICNRTPESEEVTRVVYAESQTATNFTDEYDGTPIVEGAQPRS